MFNRSGEFDKIKLQWEAYEYESHEEQDIITYYKKKTKNQPLSKFLEEQKEKRIFLEFIINGVELSLWLNLNLYQKKVIGPYHGLDQPLSIYGAIGQKIQLQKLFGLMISSQDALDASTAYNKKGEPDENIAEGILEEENADTMLYCSGCCGDRACGYFGIGIFKTDHEIIWYLDLGTLELKFSFEKTQYLSAFQEFIDTIDLQLIDLGFSKIDLHQKANIWYDAKEYINTLIEKYNFKNHAISKTQLFEVFKEGNIREIDAGLLLAELSGIKMDEICEEIEHTYENLSKNEKHAIDWKFIDHKEYFRSIHLSFPVLTRKAYLLYS